MLRWLSGKHRRSSSASSTASDFYRVSLDLPTSQTERECRRDVLKDSKTQQQRPTVSRDGVWIDTDARRLRRHSLPALHLQEQQIAQQSAAMMSNPPVFNNPLSRRGCCDHQHAEQMYEYRAEAIKREQACRQASFVMLEAV